MFLNCDSDISGITPLYVPQLTHYCLYRNVHYNRFIIICLLVFLLFCIGGTSEEKGLYAFIAIVKLRVGAELCTQL
jgi:hypothetical protein